MNKLFISGNYIIAETAIRTTEYSRTQSVYGFQDDVYTIYEHLDKGQLKIPVADIGIWFDEAGLVAFTESTLLTFLRGSTGATINKSDVAEITTVIVDKVTAVTLMAANSSRIGYTVFNNGSKDVVIRYKNASADNDIDGYKLSAGGSEHINDGYTGEISAIRLDTAGNQTSDIKIMEW